MQKKILLGVLVIALAAGGIFGLPYLDRWYNKVEVNSAELVSGEKISTDKKILTLYFSRVGNTNFPKKVDAVSGASLMLDGEKIIGNAEMIARMANEIVGGELAEIQTEKIYPADYSETTDVAKAEFENGELPTLKNLPDVKNFDAVILVYPLWWGTLPKPVESFLQTAELADKKILPIVTHGGGGTGSSVDVLKSSTKAQVVENCLDVYSSDISTSRGDIFNYLQKNLQ